MAKIDFAYGDAYPNMLQATTETGLLANPEKDDQEALAENESISDKADISNPSKNKTLLAIVAIAILVVLFGAFLK